VTDSSAISELAFTYQDREYYFLSKRDYIGEKIRATGEFYSIDELEFLLSIGIPPGRIVDCGAHIGNHTVFFAQVMERTVLAFEPTIDSFKLLTENVAANNCDGRVELINMALGQTPGEALMVVTPENTGAAFVEGCRAIDEDAQVEFRQVELTSLDSVVGEEPVSLLKIDVEGSELEVLRGAQKTIRRHTPVIVVECQDSRSKGDVTACLAGLGYDCGAVIGISDSLVFTHRHKHRGLAISATAFLTRKIDRHWSSRSQLPPAYESMLLDEVQRLRAVNSAANKQIEAIRKSKALPAFLHQTLRRFLT